MRTTPRRPDDMLYVHPNGTQARIGFLWGAKTSQVPQGLKIKVQFQDRNNHAFTVRYDHAVYHDLEDARTQGLALSEKLIDLLSEPLD